MSLGTTFTSIGATHEGNVNTDRVSHTTTVQVPAGSTALLLLGTAHSGARTLLSVTDNQGNTWTVDKSSGGGNNVFTWIVRLYCASALASGTIITAIWADTAITSRAIHGAYVSGRAIPDGDGSVAEGSTQPWTSGNTSATGIAGGVAWGGVINNASNNETNTTTSSPAFTELHDTTNASSLASQYATNITAATVVHAGGNISQSNASWTGIVQLYKEWTATSLGQPVSIGNTDNNQTAAATKTLTTTRAIPAGATGILGITILGGPTLVSVTDNQGHTWTIDASFITNTNPGADIHLARFQFPAGLPSGSIITVTPSSSAAIQIHGCYIPGLAVLHLSASGENTNLAAAWTTGTTAAATENGCVGIGFAFASQNTANSNQTGSTPTMFELSDSSRSVMTGVSGVNKVAARASGTWASNSRNVCILGVYSEQPVSTGFMGVVG